MDQEPTGSLGERLRTAAEEELATLVAERRDELDPRDARQAFRNPFLTGPMIEQLLARPALASVYELRREAVFHARTPRTLALRLVGGLYWADLLRLGGDTRVHPIVRRAGEQRLVERLPGFSVGEKMAIGRGAGPTVLAALRLDPSPRVIGALLENPRLTEGLLVPLAASEAASPRALALLASSPRWATRAGLRSALCRNPGSPPAAVLPLLPMLSKRELSAVASDPRLSPVVRRRAQTLGGAEAGPGHRSDRRGVARD